VLDKINTNHTYLDVMNYWAPLETIKEEDDTGPEHINSITTFNKMKIKETLERVGNKWTRRAEKRKEKQHQQMIIINSGATSHFMSKELDLPNTGPSNKEVYLPDNMKLMTANKTLLPFEQLTKAAQEADVIPGLKKSLASVNKWSEEGYTPVFHPGKKGVTVHNPETLTMTTSEPPVLQGYKPRGAKLWTVSTNHDSNKQEQSNNIYSLPLTAQSIKYLHKAAGYPVEDTWIAAINARNYNTWPGLSPQAVRCHFLELDETQKGHMKKQQQNMRSTKIKIENKSTEPPTREKKMHDVYIKIHSASATMHSNQMGCFPATSSIGNQYIMVLVEVDGNYIDAEPMKNRSAGSMVKAYHTLWK
jgi:hypothetical protein